MSSVAEISTSTGARESFAVKSQIAPSPTESKPTPNVDEAIEFLHKRHWPPCLTAIFIQPDGSRGLVETQTFESADDPKLRLWIQNRLNSANLYHHTNPTRGHLTEKATKGDIVRVASLHCEIDPESGESPDQCKARVLAEIDGMDVKPTLVVQSGNGMQLIWDLNPADQITLDGTEAMADDAALYNVALIQKYRGDKSAKDVSRILRLPGTWNIPDKGKLKKGRTKAVAHFLGGTGLTYSLGDFDKAQPANSGKEHKKSDFKFAGDYQPVSFNDTSLAVLDAETLALGRDGDVAGKYSLDGRHKRSGAAFAFAIKCIRAKLPPEKLAAIFVDSAWAISAPFLEKATSARAREVERTINNAADKISESVFEEMNRQHMAGSYNGKFRVLTWVPNLNCPHQQIAEFQTGDDFKATHINPKIEFDTVDAAGKRVHKKIPRGVAWLAHDNRSEFDGVDFRPGAPRIIEISRLDGAVHRVVNLYSGFTVEPDMVDGEEKCSLYLAHLRENVCASDDELYNYVLDWEASGVQQPGDPGRTSLSLRGEPGDGKGTVAVGYGGLFGCHFLHVTHREQVTSRFNKISAQACFIFVDEAMFAGNPADAQILKTLISEKTKILEPKGIDAFQVNNYARYIFATNDEHPLRIDHNDRRYVPIYVRPHKSWANVNDHHVKAELRRKYFTALYQQLENGGREALLGFLLQRNLSKFNPERIPDTVERKTQQLLSASAGDKVIIGFAQDGFLPAALATRPHVAASAGLLAAIRDSGGKWNTLARESDVALTDLLKRWGFERKRRAAGACWQAPPLEELRGRLSAKYAAITWDAGVTGWGHESIREGDHDSIPF